MRAEMHQLPSQMQQEVMQSLLQHILHTVKKALKVHLANMRTGRLLQLLLELQYLHAALTAYMSSRLEQDFVDLGAILTERIQDAEEEDQQCQSQQVQNWLSQAQGSGLLECMQARLAQVLTTSTTGQQYNLRTLRT